MTWRLGLVFLALSALPAVADCPPERDTSDLRAELHTRLMNARSEAEAAGFSDAIWRIWLTAPDARAQDLLDRAIARRQARNLELSEALLNRLIAYCPDYAEGYNQRAFARFLMQDYDGALADIDRVLARNPQHFGALSGKALALMQQGRAPLAQDALREAVRLNPYLRERNMLANPERKL